MIIRRPARIIHRSASWLLTICLPGILACSSSDDDGADGGPGPTTDAGGDATTSSFSGAASGAFQISLVEPKGDAAGRTTVVGKVFDGPTPALLVWEQATSEGPCQLLEPRVPRCAPPCSGGEVCVEDDRCQGYPTALGVGQVRVDGLRTVGSGEASFAMDPIANNYQPPGSVSLAHPACAEGEPVTLAAAGAGPIPAFSLTAKGIGPLELLADEIELADGKPVTLRWTPPADATLARVRVQLDISHHGGTKGKIVCDADDSGTLELSASLLDALKALGVSGFPTVILTRESLGRTPVGEGEVTLSIASPVEREVTIPGLVSCNDDEDCSEPGQTCQTDRRCQ